MFYVPLFMCGFCVDDRSAGLCPSTLHSTRFTSGVFIAFGQVFQIEDDWAEGRSASSGSSARSSNERKADAEIRWPDINLSNPWVGVPISVSNLFRKVLPTQPIAVEPIKNYPKARVIELRQRLKTTFGVDVERVVAKRSERQKNVGSVIFIVVCSSSNSGLCDPRYVDPRKKLVRIIRGDDISNVSGLQNGLTVIRDSKGLVSLWVSRPCISGSNIRAINSVKDPAF